MNKFKSVISRKAVYIPLIVVVLILAGITIGKIRSKIDYETVVAAKEDFVQVISTTGKVTAADDVDLNFETSGKVGKVNVKVGDVVKRGQILATLGSGDAYASLLGAQARLESEQIKLSNLEAGNRPEEVQILQTALSNAKNEKTQAEDTLKNNIINSFVSTDSLLKNNIDPLFRRNGNTADIIPFGDAGLKDQLDDTKRSVDQLLDGWNDSIQVLETSSYTSKYQTEALTNLTTIRTFLNTVNIAVSEFTPLPDLSQSTIDQYKAGVASARAGVDVSINTINTGQDNLETSESAIKTAEDNLTLSQAGANPFDIQAQEAAVKSAQASVQQAQSAVAKTVVSAPFDGIVTTVDITTGGLSSLSTPAISLISSAQFEIESFVPEADIAKIHLNDKASVTLDAYGSNVNFEAVVTSIDPAETEVDGISTYRTVLQFTQDDDRIKSGMTANIDVQGQVRSGVLTVPQSAIIYDDDNNKTVYILKDAEKKPEARSVRTGQTDDKGNVEVIEGITEGELVVTNPPR